MKGFFTSKCNVGNEQRFWARAPKNKRSTIEDNSVLF